MIVRLCEQQAAVAAVLHSHRDLIHLEHSPAEWRVLEDLVEVLKPFKHATTYLCSELYPSLSALGPLLHEIQKKLTINGSDLSEIKQVKRAISNDLDKWYQADEVKLLMNKATFLDPRMKSLTHLSELEQVTLIDTLINEIVLSAEEGFSDEVEENSQPTAKKCALENLLGESCFQNSDVSVNVSMTELVTAEVSRYK